MLDHFVYEYHQQSNHHSKNFGIKSYRYNINTDTILHCYNHHTAGAQALRLQHCNAIIVNTNIAKIVLSIIFL